MDSKNSKFNKREEVTKGIHTSQLYYRSCSDDFFKKHLTEASKEEIELVLSVLPEQWNKTKIRILKAELKRREK